ncbi:potassium channel family protein [Virgibacillus xinjiangensis]|uniref:Potassium channel family protein n=1 Tax=Virgibacillus xinjiangensis TaxID=393090 RepID=A0ABV7CZ72_9BACI
MSIKLFKQAYYNVPVILRLLLFIILLMVIAGTAIHYIEPDEFPTIFEGIWWAFVTAATVGYGDYVPHSLPGRALALLLILTGGGLIAFYISRFSAVAITHEHNLEKGRVAFKGGGHLVFVGWNERTRQLIDITLDKDPDTQVVLIDRTLNSLAYQHYPVHFIHGDATEDYTLIQANIKHAKCVIITADTTEKERQADNFTILTTVAVRGNNEEIPIIAEILSGIQVENAIRAGATTTLKTNDFMSALLYHEMSREKAAMPFEDTLNLLKSQQFRHIKIDPEIVGKTFREASHAFLMDDRLLVGVLRDKEWQLNPGHDYLLKENDILICLLAR